MTNTYESRIKEKIKEKAMDNVCKIKDLLKYNEDLESMLK